MRAALAVGLTMTVLAGMTTWALTRGSDSVCSAGDCVDASTGHGDGGSAVAFSGCNAFSPECRASAGATTPASSAPSRDSVSCKAPCLAENGQIIATGTGGDPWWLWSLWILIAAGVMLWGFRREAARLLEHLRGDAAESGAGGIERPEWALRALARARAKRLDPP